MKQDCPTYLKNIGKSKALVATLSDTENRAKHLSLLLENITFDPTVGFPSFLVFQKLHIQMFLGTPRST